MSVKLSDYRARIKNLLGSPDVEAQLVSEGVEVILARAVGSSRAVIAQGSIARREEKIVDREKAKGEERHGDHKD